MDEPDWAWPAWKFGMKRDDLFTTLSQRYNTITIPVQDPEAFHHDVYEISHDAENTEQFHRLMADRHQQRLRELNSSLEALAFQIIANPLLMASEQWQLALQLFRTKSYDSIIRYFASYLPQDGGDSHSVSSCSSCSEADSIHTLSTQASSTDDAPATRFLDKNLGATDPAMTNEPCTVGHGGDGICSFEASPSPIPYDSAASSPSYTGSHECSQTNPPSRSMSFSELDVSRVSPILNKVQDECEDDELPTSQHPYEDYDFLDIQHVSNDTLDSDTPTPRPEHAASTCYLELKSVMTRGRSLSPKSHLARRAAENIARGVCSRTPEEVESKVQKVALLRKRPKARRRID
ncbi:hypothetical protein CDD81_115 [Ophiocordyceps australis]|uniref:Uncharacterized protein n=1 Tax=Ophiocordyceps australis TaxID=1399860 RepID=A0A2C5XCI7_9HYPO|nr:hypothetical protein CDD81_115 [Ophiocordyceps australis]